MRIVWLAEKPSLRAASCCRVEVVKGGGGLRVSGLVSTEATVKRPSSTAGLGGSGVAFVADRQPVDLVAVAARPGAP